MVRSTAIHPSDNAIGAVDIAALVIAVPAITALAIMEKVRASTAFRPYLTHRALARARASASAAARNSAIERRRGNG
jgi:hypothetical protein